MLIRKCALAVVVATFSASYAPMLYLSFLLLVVARRVGSLAVPKALTWGYVLKNKIAELGPVFLRFLSIFGTIYSLIACHGL